MGFHVDHRPGIARLRTCAFVATVGLGACVALPTCARGQVSEGDDLIARLCSPDGAISRQATKEFYSKRDELAPVFFDRYVSADWSIKPRILERLVGTKHAVVRRKLLEGTETERTHAALLLAYSSELSPDAVALLFAATKSDDKRLRALASYALLHADGAIALFDHFHEIVPALISSFGTPLILELYHSPGDSLIFGIGTTLDALIGDRFAYLEMQSRLRRVDSTNEGGSPRAAQDYTERLVAANQDEIDNLRSYWETWWKAHSNLTTTELGVLIIERNIGILAAGRPDGSPALTVDTAEGSLRTWTGQHSVKGVEGWRAWWEQAKASYGGPPHERD